MNTGTFFLCLVAYVVASNRSLKEIWHSVEAIPLHLRKKGYNEEVARQYLSPAKLCSANGCKEICEVKNVTGDIDPSKIWQIGKDIWDVVASNSPVVNYDTDWAGAVPAGLTNWTELEQFKDQTTDSLFFEFQNIAGMILTRFDWKWSWKYGGKYNGIGNYITNAGPAVGTVYAYLTEHVNVTSQALSPVNYGTKQDPIAGIDIKVSMTSWGYFETTTVGCHYTLKGNGDHFVVNCQNGTHHC